MDFDHFERLRYHHIVARTLHTDENFPTAEDDAYFLRQGKLVEWLRPGQLCEMNGSEAAVFHRNGLLYFEQFHGGIDPGFPVRFNQLLMGSQTFNYGWYAGIFFFRFWHYGTMVDVFIDDRLPCHEGNIVSVRNRRPLELINPLLEKAMARLYGGYHAIENYTFEQIMADHFGRCVEAVLLDQPLPDLYRMISTAIARGSYVLATTKRYSDTVDRDIGPTGLMTCYTYVIDNLLRNCTSVDGGYESLIRTRPHLPIDISYTGPWSQSSPEWNGMPEHVRNALGLTLELETEFWMRLSDLVDSCDRLEFCHLIPQTVPGFGLQWSVAVFHSQWIPDVAAGGLTSGYNFDQNPHFLLEIDSADENYDKATIILELTQKNRHTDKIPVYSSIGYCLDRVIYQTSGPPLSHSRVPVFHRVCEPVRCVVNRHELLLGHYLITPAAIETYQRGEFMLRIFSEKHFSITDVTPQPT